MTGCICKTLGMTLGLATTFVSSALWATDRSAVVRQNANIAYAAWSR
jgi:hypothetical protein